MANVEGPRQKRCVTPNYPELNQAVVPFLTPNLPLHPRDDRLGLTVNNQHAKPLPKTTTKLLAVVTRPHDQIYLTEDNKGKQMVVQRSHNVAKVQHRQRNENYKPSDLRLRGKQRPAAVGVVGNIDNVVEEDALWRARQHMQNVQTLCSEQHRPVQDEEERRLAEEARLNALAKNERKMKSYKVDMGHLVTTGNSDSSVTVQGAGSDGTGEFCNNTAEERENNNISFESHGEFFDDEVYENINEDNVKLEDLAGNDTARVLVGDNQENEDETNNEDDDSAYNTKYCLSKHYNSYGSESETESIQDENNPTDDVNNDFMGDEQCLLVYERQEQESNQAPPQAPSQIRQMSEKEQRRIDMNRQREVNVRQRQQLNMEQVIVDTAESRRQEAERKAEEARQKALALNEKKMKSYKVTVGCCLDDSSTPGSASQLASSLSTSRQSITSSTTSSPSQSSLPVQAVAVTNKMTKEENERRRQAEMREKMLAARQRQQAQYDQVLQNTAETRRLEAEKKAEQARQKALALNEKKMKSYKVTMGYSLEDYLKQELNQNFERENSASLDESGGGEHQGQISSSMFTREFEMGRINNGGTEGKKVQKRVSKIETPGQGCSSETKHPTMDEAATNPCKGGVFKDLTNERASVDKDEPCSGSKEIVAVSNKTGDGKREPMSDETANETELKTEQTAETTEELTEEQTLQLYRKQMMEARLKKQREMDLLVEQEKRKGK